MPDLSRFLPKTTQALSRLALLAGIWITLHCSSNGSEIEQNHENIGSIAAIRRLYLEDQGETIPQLPVDLEAVIHFVDAEWNIIYASDPTGSIFVKIDWRFAPHGLEQGERIRIQGHTSPGDMMPIVTARKIIRSSKKRLHRTPPGTLIKLENYDSFQHDSSAVSIEVTVNSTYQAHGHTYLDGLSDGLLIRTAIPRDFDRYDPSELLGATILVNGILKSQIKEKWSDHEYFLLFASSDHTFSIVAPSPSPLRPATHYEIGDITAPESAAKHSDHEYISTSGVAITRSERGLLTIGDGDSAIEVQMPKPWHKIRRGDYLHIEGFINTDDDRLAIATKQITRLRRKRVPPPKKIELDQIAKIANRMQIETSAYIVHDRKPEDPRELLLASAPHQPPSLRAIVKITETQRKGLKPDEILTANLTGTLKHPQLGEELPTLIINSLDDITATSRIPRQDHFAWFKSVAWILASCAILTSALFLWVFTLRRQVAFRTVAIRKNARKLTDTAEKLRAAKLAEAQISARLRDIYRSVDDGILVVDPKGKPLEANPSFTRIFELKNRPLDLDATELQEALSKKMENSALFIDYWQKSLTGADEHETTEWELLSGPTTEVSAFTAPVFTPKDPAQHTTSIDTLDASSDAKEILGRVWVFRDLTRQRQLEKSLVQAQKMEAVGRLAGGIAHDFNNLLTGVTGSLGVARKNRDKPLSESEHLLETAESAARRAAELVQSLLGFSRQSSLHLKPGNSSDVIRRLQALVRHSFDAKIEVKTIIDPKLWITNLDSTHLEQVLLNMCVNAKDAMPEGGIITIEARNNPTARRSPAKPGENCIELIVKDTGTGIAPEHLATIFEPFFTTKEQGKGTGLGLAMSYGIIEQHGGWITCESSATTGTSFHIYLPRFTGTLNGLDVKPKSNTTLLPPPTHRRTLRERTPSSATTPQRSKHVLVVDDEAVVRAVAEGLFRNSGFKVSSAENGRIALDFLASLHAPGTSTSGHVDIIILDLTMPVLSGKETLRELRRLYPEVPVIIASGYLVDPVAFTKEAGASPDAFMQKPYELDEILELATTIIARSEPGIALSS